MTRKLLLLGVLAADPAADRVPAVDGVVADERDLGEPDGRQRRQRHRHPP